MKLSATACLAYARTHNKRERGSALLGFREAFLESENWDEAMPMAFLAWKNKAGWVCP